MKIDPICFTGEILIVFQLPIFDVVLKSGLFIISPTILPLHHFKYPKNYHYVASSLSSSCSVLDSVPFSCSLNKRGLLQLTIFVIQKWLVN